MTHVLRSTSRRVLTAIYQATTSSPPTNNESKKEGANTAQYASKPNFSTETPLYWFRASETFFLKAEAALYGLISTGDGAVLL